VLRNALISIIPVLFCITLHELAHGYTAYRLGDSTAKDMGRLTLNPIKHIDVFGVLMLAVFGFGWAKPVPVNMRMFKKPKTYMAITALAGPVCNILLAAVVFFILGLVYTLFGGDYASGSGSIVLELISRVATLSVALAVFNLVPIPPLDGSKVLFSLLPETAYYKLMKYERFGMIILILFIWSNYFDDTVGRVTVAARDWFLGIFHFALNLVN
jgi:Zn-dependent protease